MKDYCNKNQIKLVFIIPPTHIDLQNKIKEFNLLQEDIKFKEDLRFLGVLYDFDFKNDFTENRDNFIDPFHIQKEKSELIVKDLFSDTEVISKRYSMNE